MVKNIKNTSLSENALLYLLIASFVLSLIICIGALRANNQKMIELRQAVYTADKADVGLDRALKELREHVYSHMNTNLSSGNNSIKPPLQLKYTYERLLAAEQEKAKQTGSSVYTDAQNYCQAQNSVDFSGRNRVPCVQEYVASHSAKAVSVPVSLFQFDFVSPAWSPDLAGWSLVVTVILGFVLLGTIVFRYFAARKIRSNM